MPAIHDFNRQYDLLLTLSQTQLALFDRCAAAARHVYNKAVELLLSRGEDPREEEMYGLLPAWTTEDSWLLEVPIKVLRSAIRDVDYAFRGHSGGWLPPPELRTEGTYDTFRIMQPSIKLDPEKRRLRIAKIGWVAYEESDVIGDPRGAVFTLHQDGWHAALRTKVKSPPRHPV